MNISSQGFPTTDAPVPVSIGTKAGQLIDQIRGDIQMERAVVLTRSERGWTLAGSHSIPTRNFWAATPISLSVIQTAITQEEDILIMDVDKSSRFGERDSIFLGGMISIACVTDKGPGIEAKTLVYLDSSAESKTFSPKDLEVLKMKVMNFRF